ncbi:MAG TPA: DMT family transporter [bacterium]|nr:DMT family transporter [bacterium]
MTQDLIGKTAALGCAFIWAFAVILFKRSGESMPPLTLNVYKSTIAGIVMIPLWYLSDPQLIPASVTRNELLLLAVSGIIGITIADSLFFVCLNMLGAGTYAILDCIYSPSMIFLSWLLLGESLTPSHFLGSGLVITGILLVTSDQGIYKHRSLRTWILGSLAGISAVLLMVFSIVFVKPIIDRNSAIMIVECRMLPAVAGLHVMALFNRKRRTIYRTMMTRRAFHLAMPGALLGNVLSMLLWVAAFKYTDMGSASILNQTSVIFVVVLAAIFLKESLDGRRITATLLGFIGSAIILSGCI